MDGAYRSLFRDVSPSVVLVQQVGRLEYFCVGSVIQSEGESTFILTQSSILNSYSTPSLIVCFSDGRQLSASVVSRNGLFCILKTSFHPKCKALELFEGEVDHSIAAAIAPSTPCSVYNIPGFILQKSIETSDDVPGVQSSEKHFFIFACRYGDSCPNGKSRLISGPVFNMDSKALGFVFGDLRYKHWLRDDKNQIDPEKYIEQGFHMKNCLASNHLDEMLGSMLGDADWRKVLS
jgi:hypothetical protein